MDTCTMCNQPTFNEFPEHGSTLIQPTGGLHIAIFPGYGMFTDPMDDESCQSLSRIRLCHDCSVKLVDMFPQEFKDNFFYCGHPISICRKVSDQHPNGCHYAWT